jgi:transposase
MNLLEVTLQLSIKALAERGWSQRRIARELGVDRSTVQRYARPKPATNPTAGSPAAKPATGDNPTTGSMPDPVAGATPGEPKPASNPTTGSPGPPSLCEPHRAFIAAALERGLSAQRIYQDIQTEHAFAGSYESVKRFVRRLGLTLALPSRRMESAAGEQMQVDFGLGAPVVAEGKRRRPHLFRAVLSHSRKGYTEVVWRQDTETFIRCVENAFRHFGGGTATVVVDNLKAAVLEPDWFDPQLNPKMADFAAHYDTLVLPTEPARPEHKGKVEAGVKYAQNNACAGRSFTSLAEQNQFLADWEAKVADTRIHGTVRQQVRALFETERAHLRPLPASLFPSFTEGRRKVHRDGHVEFERAYYSVPAEYLGREVWVRGESKVIRILNHRREQIAAHVRVEPGRFATAQDHIHEHKRHGVERGATYWLDRCRLIGPATAQWAEAMHQQRGVYAIRSLQGLVSLTKTHSADVIEAAAGRATQRNTHRLRDLRGLIGTDETVVQLDWLQSHALIRDMDAYRVNALCL